MSDPTLTCIRRNGACYNFTGQPVSLVDEQFVVSLSNQQQQITCCAPMTDSPTIWNYANDTLLPGVNTVQLNIANPAYNPTANLLFPTTTGEGASNRLMFDVANGSFRAGVVTGGQWDTGNRGATSVAMGFNTTSNGAFSTVSGGATNTASGAAAVVAGGTNNVAAGARASVGGGESNVVNEAWSSICGGLNNVINPNAGFSTIAGGQNNSISGESNFIGSGQANNISGSFSFLGSGTLNSISSSQSAVVSGNSNQATGLTSFVGGGNANVASGQSGFIGGGNGNTASGLNTTISGGENNTASGNNSTVGGTQANDGGLDGCWVYSDSTGSTTATIANQFVAGVSGGATFWSDAARSFGVNLPAGGNAWAAVCDRKLKENFQPLNNIDILNKVTTLPLFAYNMIGADPSMVYLGPVAQDWHTLFPSGKDPLRIDTTDLTGVALAAIQGLHEHITVLKQQLQQQNERITLLEQQQQQ